MTAARLVPLTGVAAMGFIIAAFTVGGEPPDTDAPLKEVVSFYKDNDDDQMLSAALLAYGALFFLFFASALHKALRLAEGQTRGASALSFAGATVFAVGLAIFAGIGFTLGDVADDVGPATLQTLHVLGMDFFFPVAVGTTAFLVGTGVAVVRTAVLPKWLGWIAIVVAVVALTPAGFIAFLALGAWTLIASVLLFMRAGPAEAGTPSAGQGPAA